MLLVSHHSDGWVTIDIKGQRYEYRVDAILIPKILKVYRRSRWKALDLLKKNQTGYIKLKEA